MLGRPDKVANMLNQWRKQLTQVLDDKQKEPLWSTNYIHNIVNDEKNIRFSIINNILQEDERWSKRDPLFASSLR
jgi:predicted nucleic acid-binding OB-fold protein